jgi:GDPmannose 4,6-dehydratase
MIALNRDSSLRDHQGCRNEACRRYRKGKGVFASAGILYNHESPLRNEKFVTRKIAIAAARIARSGTGSIALGDPVAKVDWGYAPDYVDAMHRILCHATLAEYVVVTGEVHSLGEFAEIAFRIVGLNYQDHMSTQSRLLQRKNNVRVGDFARLRRDTGWTPQINFGELVRRMVSAEMKVIDEK